MPQVVQHEIISALISTQLFHEAGGVRNFISASLEYKPLNPQPAYPARMAVRLGAATRDATFWVPKSLFFA